MTVLTESTRLVARKVRTLAYEVDEPAALAMRLAVLLGYPPNVDHVVAMASGRATFETVAVAADVDAVVRIDQVQQPDLGVLRALYDLPVDQRLVQVVTVESPWVWCSGQQVHSKPVRVRRRAFADVAQAAPLLGIEVELVADGTPASAMLLGVADGSRSVILDRDEVPAGLHRHDLGPADDLSFGLISRLWTDHADYHWLALRPAAESVGTLASALQIIAAHGVDLDFLMSDALEDGSHRFFVGFGDVGQEAADRLVGDLGAAGVGVRFLASIATAPAGS